MSILDPNKDAVCQLDDDGKFEFSETNAGVLSTKDEVCVRCTVDSHQ
jgi:hypothetical protein